MPIFGNDSSGRASGKLATIPWRARGRTVSDMQRASNRSLGAVKWKTDQVPGVHHSFFTWLAIPSDRCSATYCAKCLSACNCTSENYSEGPSRQFQHVGQHVVLRAHIACHRWSGVQRPG